MTFKMDNADVKFCAESVAVLSRAQRSTGFSPLHRNWQRKVLDGPRYHFVGTVKRHECRAPEVVRKTELHSQNRIGSLTRLY
jgi:hypothetical protein